MQVLTQNVIHWIKDYFTSVGQTKAIVGISGGKDSTVVAALCVAALGKENVFGVLMPCGDQSDIADSYRVVNHLDIEYDVVNIGDAFREIGASIPGFYQSIDAKTNLPARLRMSTLYAYAQTTGSFVANTSNLSEDTVGYATLWGDSCGSFAPVSKLTTDEVMMIGDDLKLPHELVHKTPIDGLQPKSDEDKLGFTYHEVNELIRSGVRGPNFEKIMKMYRANKFKSEIIRIPFFEPHLPNVLETI